MEEIKKEMKAKFVKKATEAGFTEQQADFLWEEIQSKVAINAMFGGLL